MQVGRSPTANVDWLYQVRNGRAFSRYASQQLVAAANSHIQLLNPSGSLITIIVYESLFWTTAAATVAMTDYSTALATLVGTGFNLKAGGAVSTGVLRTTTNVGELGNRLAAKRTPAATSQNFWEPWLAVLAPGFGLTLVDNTVNETMDASFRWVEV